MDRRKTFPALACLPLAALLLVAGQGGSCGGGGSATRNGRRVPQTNTSEGATARNEGAHDARGEMNSKTETARVAAGLWGGPHVRLEVRADGAEVEFDCAHGSLAGPLALDAGGRFEVAGTFVPEGGPVSVPVNGDFREKSFPARYRGRVVDDEMTLSVAVPQTGAALDDLTLTRGRPPSLEKCY